MHLTDLPFPWDNLFLFYLLSSSLSLSLSNPFFSRNGNCGYSIFDESQWLTSRFAVKSDSSGAQVSGLVCLSQSAVWTPQLRINTPEGHFTPSATIALDVNIKWITPWRQEVCLHTHCGPNIVLKSECGCMWSNIFECV